MEWKKVDGNTRNMTHVIERNRIKYLKSTFHVDILKGTSSEAGAIGMALLPLSIK